MHLTNPLTERKDRQSAGLRGGKKDETDIVLRGTDEGAIIILYKPTVVTVANPCWC